MTNEELEAMQKAWKDFPSQDNEGYQPERGSFKAGWYSALKWVSDQKNSKALRIHVLEKEILNIYMKIYNSLQDEVELEKLTRELRKLKDE